MKVYVKNKMFSLSGRSEVVNEYNQPVFAVLGKTFSMRRKKTVCDLNGNVLYRVHNKLFNFLRNKAYILDADENVIACIKPKLFTFRKQYIIEGYKDQITTDGDFFSFTMTVFKNGTVMGTIKRVFFALTDQFEVDALNPEDMPFLVAFTIALDNIQDNNAN